MLEGNNQGEVGSGDSTDGVDSPSTPPPFTPSNYQTQLPSEAPPPEPVVEVPAWQVEALRLGRKRMRMFANHLIGYLSATTIALPLAIFYLKTDVDRNFVYLALFSWLGIIAIHASYAMKPIMENRKSEKEK